MSPYGHPHAVYGVASYVRIRSLSRAAVHVVPVAMLVFVALEWNGIPGQDRDTVAYHNAATAARAGGAIYDPVPPPGPHEFVGEWPYLYPPPLAALLAIVPPVTYRTFDRSWLILNVVAFWVLAAALSRMWGGSWTLRGTGTWGAVLFFMPGTLVAIHFGNIEIVILALVAVGLAVPAASGLSLAMATAFKVTPLWPLLTLAARRPRRTLPGTAAALALCTAACALAFGPAGTVALSVQWVYDIMPGLAQGQFWGESFERFQQGGLRPQHYLSNLSPSYLPVQLSLIWGWWEHDGGSLPNWVRVYLTAVGIGAPLLIGWLTRGRSPGVQAALILVAAMFAAPIVRPYALPAFLLVIAAVRQERRCLLPARATMSSTSAGASQPPVLQCATTQ